MSWVSMSRDCRGYREKLGDLAIGRLGDSERGEVESHLETCADCRAEAAGLRRTAALLPLVTVESLSDPAQVPPSNLEKQIESRIRVERKIRRTRRRSTFLGLGLAGAAAAALVVLAIVLVGGSPDHDEPATQQLAFASVPAGVDINGSLRPRATGTEISLDVSGVKSGTLCRVFVRTSDGTVFPAGSFRYRYEYSGEPSVLSTGVDLSDIEEIEIKVGAQTFTEPA
ncbi:MAG: zf-HC2 domain-containing protein [Thermoleophilia bacterium]|nr:zf-HC2 domain-containing protein [Thermoleophilia bacterium]